MAAREDLGSLLGPEENIVILGPPGGGKTSLAKVLSLHLSMPIYDIDDDHLERVWGCTVASKLSELGDDLFVQAEGEALCLVKKSRTIISLSGSNPLHAEGMRSLRENNPNSIFLYLDVSRDDIIQRLQAMKVNRIVGQATRPMSEILDYRASFYEKYYDLRVLVPKGSSQDQVSTLALSTLEEFLRARHEHMSLGGRYISTRQKVESNRVQRMNFGDVVLQGLADDGGLFVPTTLPKIEPGQIQRLSEFAAADNYAELALRVLEKFVYSFELKPQLLRGFIEKAYDPKRWNDHRIAHLQPLKSNDESSKSPQYLLELFHGPTGSFKDFALQLFPLIFEHFAVLKAGQGGQKFAILVSTSGDTGSATMDGFCSQTKIPVVCLFPANGVSAVQRAQMVSSTFSNLRVLPIEAPADFDFCQSTLKQLFNDSSFIQQLKDEFNLSVSAANSINWGRLLPQIAYHVFAFASLVAQNVVGVSEPVDICVPTGNFGNILAGLYARSCGIPISRLICATNENDVLRDFIQTGVYDIRNRNLHATSSPSIDILKSSNLERMLHLIERDGASIAAYFDDLAATEKQSFTVKQSTLDKIHEIFLSGTCREQQALTTIKNEFQKSNTVLDPHTAVAKYVADEKKGDRSILDRPVIICATAHYVKFPGTVLQGLTDDASGDLRIQITKMSAIVREADSLPKIHERVKYCCYADEIQAEPIAASQEAIRQETIAFLRNINLR